MENIIINKSTNYYDKILQILKTKFDEPTLKNYINKEDLLGNTAILYASYRGNLRILESLVECGANINIISKKGGLNVLHMAAQGNNPNIIIYFKEKYNFSVNIPDSSGNLPLHWACYNSSEEAIDFLLSFMDNINIQNNDGITPLHIAIFTEKPSLIKKLLKKGADVTIKDKANKTPITLSFELTGYSSKITNILLSSQPKKSCLDNFCKIKNNNKKINKELAVTPPMYLIANIIFWTLDFFLQLDYLPKIYSFIFFILIFGLLFSFTYISFSDPGKIENLDNNYDWITLVIKDINIKNMCPYCKVKRQRLSRHCFICNKCVKEQDCHCNVINNCVGQSNSDGYIVFLMMNIIVFIYIFFTSIKVFLIHAVVYDPLQFMLPVIFLYKKTVKDIAAILFITFCVIGSSLTLFVTLKHIKQIVINNKIKEIDHIS